MNIVYALNIFISYFMLIQSEPVFSTDSLKYSLSDDLQYFDVALNRQGHNGYYISLFINSDTYKGKVVVISGSLYHIITKHNNLLFSEYKKILKNILISKDTLRIKINIGSPNNNGQFEIGLSKVEKDSIVDYYAIQGKDVFVDFFFEKGRKYRREKHEVFESIRRKNGNNRFYYSIIDQLIEWRYFVTFDCYDGDLVIELKE